jgi:hypothetical protein
MSVDVVNDPDTQIVLGAGKTIGASANGTSSPERSVLFMSRLKAFWRLLNLPCQGISRLASESLDRDLGHLERFALRSHLLCCTSCRRIRAPDQVPAVRHAAVARARRGRRATARYRSVGQNT